MFAPIIRLCGLPLVLISLIIFCLISGKAAAELVLYLPFDEGSGIKVADNSGQGNSGTAIEPVWTEGISGSALSFEGGEWVEVPSSDNLDSFPNGFSIMAWVLNKGQTTRGRIYQKGNHYAWINKEGDFGWSVGSVDYVKEKIIPQDKWAHLAITYDKEIVRFYHNGLLVSDQQARAPLESTRGHTFYIGLNWDEDGPFYGVIDEFRVYNVALSGDEIKNLSETRGEILKSTEVTFPFVPDPQRISCKRGVLKGPMGSAQPYAEVYVYVLDPGKYPGVKPVYETTAAVDGSFPTIAVGSDYRDLWIVSVDDNGNTSPGYYVLNPAAIPTGTKLLPSRPNPFKPGHSPDEVILPYELKEDADKVTIRIFTAAGELVKTLENMPDKAGKYLTGYEGNLWDGTNQDGSAVASGIYIYTIEAGSYRDKGKLLLVR